MDSLYQRLKERDPDTFQKLCFHILKEKHTSLQLKHVEGASGDEGLDVFEGELDGHPAIWQCKSFPNGVRDSQKDQIRKSLKAALKHFSPKNWILCLSVDFDAKTHRWFQRLHKSYAPRVNIGLFSASDIVHELIHRRSIRNHFFPEATIDPTELKRLILRTGDMMPEELERITDANVEDVIERMKERDARFNYQIIYDGDLGPVSRHPHPPPPGLVASLSTGMKTINVFARDVQALTANPPSFRLSLKGTGVQKALELWKTGIQQEFNSEELGPVTTDLPLLASFLQSGNPPARLIATPPPTLTNRKRAVRVTFRQPHKPPIEYSVMELSPTRVGAQEAEFICRKRNLFFEIVVVMPLPLDRHGHPTITIRHARYLGEDVRQVKKFLDALAGLREGGELEFFDLEAEAVFATVGGATLGGESPAELGFHQIVTDLAQIAERFGVEIRLPSDMSDQDSESIVLLKTLIQAGTLSIENISAVLVKSEENRHTVPQLLTESGGRLRLEHQRCEPMPKLFGQEIDTGPCAVEADVQFNNLAATLQNFQAAAIGEGTNISCRPVSPVRLLLLSKEELQQPQRLLSKKNE